MAGVLAGGRGRVLQAAAIGLSAGLAHTLVVFLLCAAAAYAHSSAPYTAPLPWLSATAGLAAILVGARQVARPHVHGEQVAVPVRFSQALALGVVGGLVPCPSALGVLAVSLGTPGFGGAMWTVVGFGAGLCITLMAVGLGSMGMASRLRSLPGTWVVRGGGILMVVSGVAALWGASQSA